MGGGTTTEAITVDPRIKAAVIYAPTSADKAAVQRWRRVPSTGPKVDLKLIQAYNEASIDSNFLYRASPINYFYLVVAPVQLHIGTKDSMTPPYWAEDIYHALQAAGKEVQYFTYPEQGHAFHGESWQLFMQRVGDFFDQHLKE
jgi:dipeptidyl aminopeptidase/acylaminoacyl peptidase